MAGWEGDWSSEAALRGRNPRTLLNQARGAMAERFDALTSPPWLLPTPVAGTGIKSWGADFQTVMSSAFPRYANHTLYSGDFTGQDVIPVFTEATMIAALGDAARLPVPTAEHLVRPWIWQQYRMLNMLRWTAETTITFGASTPVSPRKQQTSIVSWADCESKFAAEPWGGVSSARRYWAFYGSATWWKIAYRSAYDVITIDESFGHAMTNIPVDVYALDNSPSGKFVAIGPIAHQGKMNRVKQLTGAKIYTYTFWDDDSVFNSLPDPFSQGYDVRFNTAYTVSKYDASGGFTYKDW